MSGTTDFMVWALEKYGEDEDGLPTVGFDRCWEFFADDLDSYLGPGRPTDFDYDFFLSYSWKDQEGARELATSLQQVGLKVWLDVDVVRQDEKLFFVWRVLRAGLRSSGSGIAVVTPNFLRSEWALHETRGMNRNGLLTAVVVKGIGECEALDRIGIDRTGLVVLDATVLCTEEVASAIGSIDPRASGPSRAN